MSAYSETHEGIFVVLSELDGGSMTAREIYDAGPFERIDLVHAAVHALSQNGGPLKKITPDDGGKLRYQLREGITRESFRKPPYAQIGKAKREALGVAPSKAITSPAPLRADEVTRKAPEAPATARTVSQLDKEPNTPRASTTGTAGAPSVQSEKPAAAKVVNFGKSVDAYETIEARLNTNLDHLISAACMSADPVVRGFGVTVKELKGIRELLRTTKGRDAA